MDWPIPFLAEEVWLRARRCLMIGLSEHDLVPSHSRYSDYMEVQNAKGEKLCRRFEHFLSDECLLHFCSERFLGPDNKRFSQRLPITLAFGYECGYLLCQLGGGSSNGEKIEQSADCAALFNLASVLFDSLIDRAGLVNQIQTLLPRDRLFHLWSEASAAEEFLGSPELKSPNNQDLRVFAEVLAAFFKCAHCLKEVNSATICWTELWDALDGAYSAQLASVKKELTYKEANDIGRKKSVAPFIIFSILSKLTNSDIQSTIETNLAREVGELIAGVDDLVDIESDLRLGNLNRVLPNAGLLGQTKDPRAILAEVLTKNRIEVIAKDVLTHFEAILVILERNPAPLHVRNRFVEWMSMYLIDWLR